MVASSANIFTEFLQMVKVAIFITVTVKIIQIMLYYNIINIIVH